MSVLTEEQVVQIRTEAVSGLPRLMEHDGVMDLLDTIDTLRDGLRQSQINHEAACNRERELRSQIAVARLEEARWWGNYPGIHTHPRSIVDEDNCLACQRIAKLQKAAPAKKE